MREIILLFFVLIFTITLKSNAQTQNNISHYNLQPEAGIKLSPRPELGLVGIGAIVGVHWDNPAKRIDYSFRLNYLTTLFYWEVHDQVNYDDLSAVVFKTSYEMFYTFDDEPVKLGLDVTLLMEGFFQYRNNYPYQLGISLIQEYHNFDFELALKSLLTYYHEPFSDWRLLYNPFINIDVSYSFDFSGNQ